MVDQGQGSSEPNLNQYDKDQNKDGWIDCEGQVVGSSYPARTTCQQYGSMTPACPFRDQPHNGIDYAVDLGTEVYSVGVGYVSEVGHNASNGNFVRVNHPDGTMSTYIHLKDNSIAVAQNQRVVPGTKLAEANNTGASQGNHLHLTIWTSPARQSHINPTDKINTNCGGAQCAF